MFTFTLVVLGLIALIFYARPKDNGRPHNLYFSEMQKTLKRDAPGHPVLVLDLDRLDDNIATSQQYFIQGKSFRVVAKSLPSLPLLKYISDKTGSHKIMVFHRPFLNLMIEQLPQGEFLLGKPFPVQAVHTFFKQLSTDKDIQLICDRIQWLIDSEGRAQQYLQIAKLYGVKLKLSIELDVGIHRGGLTALGELRAILDLVQGNVNDLEYTGFMGYEPHIAKIPMSNSKRIEKARNKAMSTYQTYVNCVKNEYPKLYHDKLIFNGAGSPTYQLYGEDRTLNDLCLGSSLVKPTDFDLSTLNGKRPAIFIATPVIKKLQGTNLPFIEKITPWVAKYIPNWQQSVFTYGGYWKAQPCSPRGVQNNSFYGRSSNQEIFNMSASTQIEQDDYIFLRPTQSEAVMLEFTDLLVLRNGEIIDNWKMFNQDLVKYSVI